MRINNVRILAFIWIFSVCWISCNKIDPYKLKIDDLIGFYFSNSDTTLDAEIIGLFEDSLKTNCNSRIGVLEAIDSSDKSLNILYYLSNEEIDECIMIKQRNVLEIFVRSNGEIKLNGETSTSLDSITQQIKEFILNPNDRQDLPQREIKIIDLLDTIMVSRHGIFIYTEPVVDSLPCRSDWESLRIIGHL